MSAMHLPAGGAPTTSASTTVKIAVAARTTRLSVAARIATDLQFVLMDACAKIVENASVRLHPISAHTAEPVAVAVTAAQEEGVLGLLPRPSTVWFR